MVIKPNAIVVSNKNSTIVLRALQGNYNLTTTTNKKFLPGEKVRIIWNSEDHKVYDVLPEIVEDNVPYGECEKMEHAKAW